MTASAEGSPVRRLLKRVALVLSVSLTGFLVIICIFLLLYQDRMIYFPQRYPDRFRTDAPEGMADVVYTTSEGRQTAFYIPPSAGGMPERLWVCFNGNMSRATDWLDYTENFPDREAGFLLVDYPGYGISEGRPSRRAIQETGTAAIEQLARDLGTTREELEKDINAMGFSLGAAAAMEFAVRHPVRKVVLLAPFSSMLAMAQRSVGWPLNNLLTHRFDSIARLEELSRLDSPPRVFIYHGTKDQVIPVEMSREMAQPWPAFVTWEAIEGVDHGFLPFAARPRVWQAMLPSAAADGDTTPTESPSRDARPARPD